MSVVTSSPRAEASKDAVPPVRPWVGMALAVAFGSSLGGLVRSMGAPEARSALALSLAALLVWLVHGRARVRWGGLLLFLALVSGFRAAAPVPGGRATAPIEFPHADAFEGSSEPRLEGLWRASASFTGSELGRVGKAPELEIARGTLRRGDRIQVLSVHRQRKRAQATEDPGGGPAVVSSWQLRPDEVLVLERAPRPWLGPVGRTLQRWRQGLLERLRDLEAPTSAGLAAALVTGDRSELPPGLSDLFVRTGTRHLLALSGLHLALFAWLLAWPVGTLLGRFLGGLGPQRGRGWRASLAARGVTSGAILFAVLVGGGAAPLARAGWAVIPAVWAALLPAPGGAPRGTGRRRDAPTLVGIALVLECAHDGRAVLGLGVQLSYAATAGLLLAAGAVQGRLRRPAPSRLELGTPSAFLRWLTSRITSGLVAAIAASWIATLATLPVAWSSFGELAPIGILVTPLLVVPVAVAIVLAWAWVVLPWKPVEVWLERATDWGVGLLELADQLPATPLPLPPRPPELLVLASVMALLALAGHLRARRLSGVLFGIALLPLAPAARTLELHVFDVGHGTCVVLRAPGPWTLIFDAGSRDRPGLARGVLGPALRRWEVRRPRVVVSHLDRDHAGSLPWVLQRFAPHYLAGARDPRIEEAIDTGVPLLDLERGRCVLEEGPGIPDLRLVRGLPRGDNEGSRSLLVHQGGQRLLLCGDAEGEGLLASLVDHSLAGPINGILLPHHGAWTPAVERLLSLTRPDRVWISAEGRPPVADHLELRGVPAQWTGKEGPLRWSPGTEGAASGQRAADP